MAKSQNSKLKLLYLLDYLARESDQDHHVTVQDIQEHLSEKGIKVERKTIYDDIEALDLYGVDIITEKDRYRNTYFIGERDFQLAEIKLLIDIISSTKFISKDKSDELSEKLKGLTSIHEASRIKRELFVPERAKSSNEKIYYLIDDINTAINENKKIRFHYGDWTPKKKIEAKKGGAFYKVSPFTMVWDNQFYYLMAYDSRSAAMRTYRVDKIIYSSRDFSILDEEREGFEEYEKIDMERYAVTRFGMFSGEECNVTFKCRNDKVGILIDRFGQGIVINKLDDEYVQAIATVGLSEQFFGWLVGLGDSIEVTSPDYVLDFIREQIRILQERYN